MQKISLIAVNKKYQIKKTGVSRTPPPERVLAKSAQAGTEAFGLGRQAERVPYSANSSFFFKAPFTSPLFRVYYVGKERLYVKI